MVAEIAVDGGQRVCWSPPSHTTASPTAIATSASIRTRSHGFGPRRRWTDRVGADTAAGAGAGPAAGCTAVAAGSSSVAGIASVARVASVSSSVAAIRSVGGPTGSRATSGTMIAVGGPSRRGSISLRADSATSIAVGRSSGSRWVIAFRSAVQPPPSDLRPRGRGAAAPS